MLLTILAESAKTQLPIECSIDPAVRVSSAGGNFIKSITIAVAVKWAS